MKSVYIDAGHGGNDPGATNGSNKEKTINLNVSLEVKKHLERHNVKVFLSRSGDTNPTLSQRTNDANSKNVNCFVSIHCNSFSNTSSQGVETFSFEGNYPTSEKLRNSIHDEVIKKGLYTKNRGYKKANFHVLRETKMDAALIEMAFISNSQDLQLLLNRQKDFAECIAKGILSYFGISWKNEIIEQPKPSTGNTYYRVCVGSYQDKNNAIKRQEELKAKGFDSFLVAYNK